MFGQVLRDIVKGHKNLKQQEENVAREWDSQQDPKSKQCIQQNCLFASPQICWLLQSVGKNFREENKNTSTIFMRI